MLEQIKKEIYTLYNETLRKDIYFNTSSYTWLLGSEVLKELENTNLIIFNTLFAIKVIEDVENETSIKLLKDVTEV